MIPVAQAPFNQKTILIVEDNALNMKLFRDILESQGYKTIPARDGHEALEAALLHVPDLIILDIQLPEVSGIEVLGWFREQPTLCSIPIIAVTALAMKGDEEKIREAGCDGYMSKPISIANLIKSVAEFIPSAETASIS